MERSVVFATPHLAPLLELSRMAEAEGYFRAWTTEYTDRDALIRCALIGAATSTLNVGTGIAYSFNRHPVALATAALDVHESTGGRFALGLGAGTRGIRQRWFGLDEAKPVARMREAVQVVRAMAAAAGHVTFHGEYYNVDIDGLDHRARFQGWPPLRIYGSGINSAMMRAAGQWCDGVLLHPLAVGGRGDQRVAAALTAPDGQRDRALWLSQWVVTAVCEDHDEARAIGRRALSFYLSTPSYAKQFSDTPWEKVPAIVAARFRELGPRWDVIAQDVPDAMLDEYAIAGTPGAARERLAELEASLAASGVDELVLQVATTGLDPADTAASVAAALTALARR